MKTVVLVGATGNFGSYVARALLSRGAAARLLVRSGSEHKLPDDVAGASTVLDIEDPDAFRGADVVVSTIQGGPDVIIDTQLRLLRTAREAGVQRFLPSDYSMDFFGLAEGENINSDWRRAFAHRADAERGDVEVVHLLQGCFLDTSVLFGFLGAVDLARREAYLWGDGDEPMQFTTFTDTADYAAAAALDDRPVPARLYVAGDSLNFHQLVDETSAGIGEAVSVVRLGTLADLDAEIERRRTAEPSNIGSWLPLMYWRGMLSGKGKLGRLDNDRYPDITPVGVREYVRSIAALL